MKTKLITTIQHILAEVRWHKIVLSVFTGLVIAIIIVLPFIAAAINLLLIYIRYLYVILYGLNLILSIGFFLWAFFSYQAIQTYLKTPAPNIRLLMLAEGILGFVLAFIVGMILIHTITPTLI